MSTLKPEKIEVGQVWTCIDEGLQLAYLRHFTIKKMTPDENRAGWEMLAFPDVKYWVLEETLLNDPRWAFVSDR